MSTRTTIRQLRDAAGESQVALSRAIGCSAAQVAAWESGAAPLPAHRRAAIAAHYGIAPDDIVAPMTQRAMAAARIAELEAELEELRARVAELEARGAGRAPRRARSS